MSQVDYCKSLSLIFGSEIRIVGRNNQTNSILMVVICHVMKIMVS